MKKSKPAGTNPETKKAYNIYITPRIISVGGKLAKQKNRSFSQEVTDLIEREANRLGITKAQAA